MSQLGIIATTRQIQYKNGRRLAFAEFGNPDGTPVFLFHGLLGTRLYRYPDDALTESLGIRLITVDRPGLGMSDIQPDRTLLDWPDTVADIADVLKIERFVVLGHSAGGPYAAACAFKLPDRVRKASIVAGFPPIDQPKILRQLGLPLRGLYRIVRNAPWLVKIALRIFWRLNGRRHDNESVLQAILKPFPEPDQELFSDPDLRDMMLDNIEELRSSGSVGYAEEMVLLSRPWGFQPEQINVPVSLWWGESEIQFPIGIAQHLASAIPNSQLHTIPNAGHYLIFSHWKEILSDLIS